MSHAGQSKRIWGGTSWVEGEKRKAPVGKRHYAVALLHCIILSVFSVPHQPVLLFMCAIIHPAQYPQPHHHTPSHTIIPRQGFLHYAWVHPPNPSPTENTQAPAGGPLHSPVTAGPMRLSPVHPIAGFQSHHGAGARARMQRRGT